MSLHTCFPCVRSIQAKQEKVTAPPGAHPGSRPESRHAAQIRERACTGIDKLSPNGQSANQ